MEENIFKDLKEDIDKLKNSFISFQNFIQEIKDLKKTLHISADSNVSVVNILSLAIKDDVLKDMNSMIAVTDEKIHKVSEESKDYYKDTLEKIDSCKNISQNLDFEIKNAEELIVRYNSIQEIFRKDIDYCRKELNDKAGYVEIIKMQKSLKHCAKTEDIQAIKTRINELAEKTQIDSLKKETKNLNNSLADRLTKKEAEDLFENLEAEMFKKFSEAFVAKGLYFQETSIFEKKTTKDEDDIKTLFKKMEMFQEGFKRKIGELFDIVNSKPWDTEIKHMFIKVDNSVSKNELVSLKEDLLEKMSINTKKQTELMKKNETFELIIERYDEIILDKASKDDFLYLSKQIEKCLLITSYKEYSDQTANKITTINNQISQITQDYDSVRGIVSTLSHKIEIIKRKNTEVSNICATLQVINETLERKSDKSDIFMIYDIMGRKEEITKLTEIEEISRKQMLIAVSILQTLCRTFLYSGENQQNVKKQRLDIYKTLEGLQKWIKEGNGEPSTMLPNGRSNINLKTDICEESYIGHFSTAKTTRRLRMGSQGASPRYFKDDLPAINL